ncbi:MAG: fibronectin type III domain-containing protein [Lachnospiraceae bacterium]|nr:fibronectin type III domain-containing protein [Lachnospiraceae bacterium]
MTKQWENKGLRYLLLLLLTVVCLLAGGKRVLAATELSLQGEEEMAVGSSQTVTLTNLPDDLPEGYTCTWTSNRETVLKVSESGESATLKAVGVGGATAKVTIKADGVTYGSASLSVTVRPATPTLKAATATGLDKIKVTWKAADGAEGYRIYRWEAGDSSYSKVGEVSGQSTTSFTDTGCTAGVTYYYTVKAYGTSLASGNTILSRADETGVSTKTNKFKPVLKSIKVVSSTSIKVTWKTVSGADSYRVYRKTGSGKWKVVQKSTTKTSYTDTGLSCGTTYTYTVRAFSGSEKTSYDTTGLSLQAAPVAPTLTSTVTKGKTSLQINWESVEGADGYRIYRKDSNGKWKKLKTLKGVSYTDTTVKYKTNYTYTVKAYAKVDGQTVWSSYDAEGITGKTVSSSSLKSTIGTPKLVSAKGATYSSITVTWKAVSGVDGYVVYRKNSSGSWKAIKVISDAETVTYTDKKRTFGTTYTYTVRAYLNYDDSRVKGSCDTTGVSGTPKLAAPTLKSATSTGTAKIVVKWSTVSGAEGYRIYRKTKGGSWSKLKTLSGKVTSYSDTSIKVNTTYYYTVKAYRTVNGKKVLSYYDKTGISAESKVTYKYKNGLKLYYDSNGNLITDVEDLIGEQDSYYIKVNKSQNVVTVYAKDDDGQYVVPVKSFVCSTGTATPSGTYTTPSKYRWHELMGPSWGQWCTRITGGVLFHSVFYNSYNNNMALSVSAYNKLGTTCSHGCVRLTAGDAKWIYDNCKLGTKVTIYSSSTAGPFGKPSAYKLSSSHTWDPTDPTAYYKCKANGCH